MYERKRLLPLRDAIILHLEPLSNRVNPYTMPDSTCQEAMSERLSASRGNLSRVMNELKNDGYLEEIRAHVPIGTLRRKTYVLTEVGMREARYLRNRTGNREIRYKTEDGEDRVRLSDISMDIRDGSSFLDVALNVHKGVFDKQDYIEKARSRAPFVCIEKQRPRILHFFGREEELQEISDWHESGEKRILEVKGVAGIGKSALVATAFDNLKLKTNTIWIDLIEQSSIETILEDIAAFFKLLGDKRLDDYLKSLEKRRYRGAVDTDQDDLRKGDMKPEEEMERGEILYILMEGLKELETIIVMDGCEKVVDELAGFISTMLKGLRNHHKSKAILVGRDMSKFPELDDADKQDLLGTIVLEALDFESSKKILQMKGVETWRLEDVYRQTGGLPFFMDLIGPEYESQTTDVESFLEEEVLRQLGKDERRVLKIASVFDAPVHSDAFFQWRGVKYGTIRSLVEKCLLLEVSPMVYVSHDILRDFLKSKLKGETKKKYHKWAAEYFLEQGEVEDILRGSSHLVEAGQWDMAASLVGEEGRKIIAKGHSRKLYEILQRLDTDKRFQDVPELAFLKAECLFIQGAWDDAVDEYNNSLLLSEEEDNLELLSTVLRKISEIQMYRGNLENVMESLKRSARISKDVKDMEGLAGSYYDIAVLLRLESDYEESETYANKCLKAARSSGEKVEIAKAYRALGVIKGYTGKRGDSIRIRQKAIDFAKESGDLALLSDCYGNLAGELYDIKKIDEAMELDSKALETARESGNARMIAWTLSNLASVYISQEDYTTATECLDEAVDIYRQLQEHRLLAQIYVQYGYVYEDEDWSKAKRYLKKGLDLINAFGNLANICEYYINVGHLYLWRGDDEGMTYIDEATAMLDKIEELELRERLESKIQDALDDAPKGN